MDRAAGRVADRDGGVADHLLREGLGRLGIQATPAQLHALGVYRSELLRWAARVNLTGFKSDQAIVREGLLRSLSYTWGFEPAPGLIAVDIGSGAGLPGLVLKICYPEIEMLLVDAARRRVTFMRHVIRQLGLTGVRCLRARAEDLQGETEHRRRYHLAFARAVGTLPDVVALAEPLLAPGGRLVVQVGQKTALSLEMMRPPLTALDIKAAMRQAPGIDAGLPPTQLLILEKSPHRTTRCFT
ncbi:MAG: 16S rRNA (guanine(527)-N(7))-methyltransferase RsmG [Candidatus Methylomirabilis oxyfera]|nr:16S rRNA (guanine(527)-N(7))-methyltransferase RsmG [Candidatus Methylomirabilis oxyfera]